MEGDTLSDFIDDVCGESRLRVEDDLGDGFVRLRSSEAERRQAAQDIRSSEDVVIELLRNARDAGASRIFLATQKTGNARLLTVLDDGQGIPAAQHERIFEPRVTSKLDSAHMDKWGMHGRGMALYSISVNAEEARVLQSEPGLGTSLTVATDTESLAEKTDQSTFPRFEQEPSGSWAMRGPKNIVRTAAEFALEHRGDLSVYLGTPVEVAATLYQLGLASLSPAVRAFGGDGAGIPLVKRLALAAGPADLAARGAALGLPDSMVYRQPFPGPGLGVRCLGAITRDRLEAVRESDAILRDEFQRAGLNKTVWQYFTIVPEFRSVGVRGGERSFEYPVILRAVNTVDAMTAEVEELAWPVLHRVTDRILREVPGVNRVCYDLSPKPVATIEWE